MLYALIVILGLLMLADFLMTEWALRHGYVETNPIMKWAAEHTWPALIIKVAAFALFAYLILLTKSPAVAIPLIIIAAYPVIHNIRVFSRRK